MNDKPMTAAERATYDLLLEVTAGVLKEMPSQFCERLGLDEATLHDVASNMSRTDEEAAGFLTGLQIGEALGRHQNS